MEKELPASKQMCIGDLVLDTGKRQVCCGDSVLDLPKLSYKLVLALARAAPNLLTHNELVEQVWPGKYVSPETLTQRIKLVRHALGDDAQAPKYIGLVRGEGYRMLAPVHAMSDAEESLSRHLWSELGRRRVLQTAIIYAAAAWSITEVLSFLIDALPVFPEWSKTLVAILFVVGFPVAMFLAWRFDVGPGGIRRTHAGSTEGRLTIAAASLLLVGATAGLFYLIYPQVVAKTELANGRFENVATPGSDTIAVLPFVNASKFEDDQYISDGLGNELRDQLGRIAGMRVAARASSVIFKEQTIAAPEIASRLGVAKLIDGTVRRQGDILLITITIIDGKSGFQDWTRSFREDSSDLLAIQQEIATAIVAAIMPDADPSLATAASATMDATANELLQLARYDFQAVKDQQTVDIPLMLKAISLYRQSTVADPGSALAHSRLGEALLYLGDVSEADIAIKRALAINPELSEVQHTLGLYLWMTFQDGSGKAHAKAIELNPSNADALGTYGKWLWHQQITDASEVYFLRAIQLDPLSLSRYIDLGNFYGVSGQRDKALEVAGNIQERFDSAPALLNLARIHELVGNLDVSIAWAMRSRAADPNYPDAIWMLGELYARIGDPEGAAYFDLDFAFNVLYWERRYEEMIDIGLELAIDHENQVQIWFGLARAYLATGDYAQAIYLLERQGIPDAVFVTSRRGNGIEALMTYADALNATGEDERAREYANWIAVFMKGLSLTGSDKSWWTNIYEACARSVLGEDDRSLELLQIVARSPGLPSYPVLKDSRCFQKFSGDPRYESVITAVELRQEILRDRLTATLQRFQVTQ